MAGREEILIEGFRPRDLPDALGPELEAEVMNGRPMVARIGTAETVCDRIHDCALCSSVAASLCAKFLDAGSATTVETLSDLGLRESPANAASQSGERVGRHASSGVRR